MWFRYTGDDSRVTSGAASSSVGCSWLAASRSLDAFLCTRGWQMDGHPPTPLHRLVREPWDSLELSFHLVEAIERRKIRPPVPKQFSQGKLRSLTTKCNPVIVKPKISCAGMNWYRRRSWQIDSDSVTSLGDARSLSRGSRASFKCGGERAGFKSWTQYSTNYTVQVCLRTF